MLRAIGIAPRASRNPGSGDAAEEPEVIDIHDDSDEDEVIPPPGTVGDGEEKDEEDEAAVGIKEKPLFLDDDDATMQSGDENMDMTGSADMTSSAVPERRGSCS